MDDSELVRRIGELADEEHALERSLTAEGASDGDRQRLADLEVALDQCWDLLRQRRALAGAGLDPDGARVRDESVVERYEQ
jgi:hypothetical protein